jgi:alkyl sulfatase BDS1-like metallo-beta-lactamase superfamily hydrolase
MSTELFLDFRGIRMDSRKAKNLRFTINLITPDNGEKFLIEMDKPASRRSYQDFFMLWKDADPDIPIYKQAKAEYAKLR